jgi:hypothetical protein
VHQTWAVAAEEGRITFIHGICKCSGLRLVGANERAAFRSDRVRAPAFVSPSRIATMHVMPAATLRGAIWAIHDAASESELADIPLLIVTGKTLRGVRGV